MITSKQYKIDLLKILGLAFLSPIGKLVISIPELGIKIMSSKFFISFVYFSLIGMIGIIMLFKGYEVLEKD